MPDLLVDTQVLLWWRTDSERLPKSQARLLSEAEERGEKPIPYEEVRAALGLAASPARRRKKGGRR